MHKKIQVRGLTHKFGKVCNKHRVRKTLEEDSHLNLRRTETERH